MKKLLLTAVLGLIATVAVYAQGATPRPRIYIAFHWHMHQPIYYPYESVVATNNANRFSFSLNHVHTSRSGPYTTWPRDAVMRGVNAGFGNFGAQVSFSGSLIENLENLAAAGVGFQNWKAPWNFIKNQNTVLGNPRIDMVGFGYHHPLMPFLDYNDIRRQIQWHRETFARHFPGAYSRGFFPPETAFSVRMIPALVAEGVEWVLIDNIHIERAAENAPTGIQSGIKRPNRADVRHPDPGDWVQLNGLWAPTPISARWAHQPRFVKYTDPATGTTHRIIGVPASRYIGNENGRGGFGALNYELVLSQLEPFNTDPNRPILIVMHHDGDNHGGGSESFYNSNFANMIQWLQANSHRFQVTTIQDYLERYPPPIDDAIHVQDGSWVGADAGDPQFLKWNGTPGMYQQTPNYSPDRNSWGILTAAQNFVETAYNISPNDSRTQQSWRYYMVGQTSCYWYWDGTEIWDSNPVRGANLAMNQAAPVVAGGVDRVAPSIFLPQRLPYNPGEVEWEGRAPAPSDFSVWTYAFDVSGLRNVTLKYRISESNRVGPANMVYATGAGVGPWKSIAMVGRDIPSITNPLPLHKAQEFTAMVNGYTNVLIDYYVESTDVHGNVSRTAIQHVWVGSATAQDPGGNVVTWSPEVPIQNQVITIRARGLNNQSRLHWGIEQAGQRWRTPIEAYRPPNTTLHASGAVQTPFQGPDAEGFFHVSIGPFNNPLQVAERINFVLRVSETQWNNNNGNDFHITINNQPSTNPIGANSFVSTTINTPFTFAAGNFPFSGGAQAVFSGINIITTVASGTLSYNGQAVVAGTVVANVSSLVYTPPAGVTGEPLTSFTYRLRDNLGNLSERVYSMGIRVGLPYPTSHNASVSAVATTTLNFRPAFFPFASLVGAQLQSVVIESLPAKGQLLVGETLVQAGADVNPQNLSYRHVAGEWGMQYAQFVFRVRDSNGRLSQSTSVMTIHILGGFSTGVSWFPANPTVHDVVTVVVHGDNQMSNTSRLHWGVNTWQQPAAGFLPVGSQLFNNTGPAVQSPFVQTGQTFAATIGPFNLPNQTIQSVNFVLFYGGNQWNNNQGRDWLIPIAPASPGTPTSVNRPMPSISQWRVFPNPMMESTQIELPESGSVFDLQIFNMQGVVVNNLTGRSGERLVLHRENLTAGVYFIRILDRNTGETAVQKLIVGSR